MGRLHIMVGTVVMQSENPCCTHFMYQTYKQKERQVHFINTLLRCISATFLNCKLYFFYCFVSIEKHLRWFCSSPKVLVWDIEMALSTISASVCFSYYFLCSSEEYPPFPGCCFLYPRHNEVVGGYIGFTPSVCLYIRPASSVRSVAPTVLIGSISYLYILSSNFWRCVACKISCKI